MTAFTFASQLKRGTGLLRSGPPAKLPPCVAGVGFSIAFRKNAISAAWDWFDKRHWIAMLSVEKRTEMFIENCWEFTPK